MTTQRAQILDLMERLNLGAILLRRPANFAWYTGGANNRVDYSSPFGAADVLVTPGRDYILTSNIEEERMRAEQTPDWEVVSYPWYEDPMRMVRRLSSDRSIGADAPLPGAGDVTELVAPLRYALDAQAIGRYRQVGRDTAEAVTVATGNVHAGVGEADVAAGILAACRRRGLFVPVLMAAGDDRIVRYRHPVIAGNRPCERRVMIVVCAERGGLYANLTRFVNFAPPDKETQRRQEACDRILARMRDEATRQGRTMSDAFEDCRRFYGEEGFPEGWRLHHQGGITGYQSREAIATPGNAQRIEIGQAFAWNPSITGAKAEETFVLTETGPEILAQ